LTVLRTVRERLPHEDIVYLADQAHVPYGDRDDDDLARLMADNVAFLEAAGAEAIVMGCNTSCAVASRRGWPPTRIPIFDLIVAASRSVVASGAARVGVIATAATARSGAYGRALRALVPSIAVQEIGAPKLVPLVESGLLNGPIARAAVDEALAPFELPLDALVLACTHYPLLDAEFAAALGPRILRIDPADAQAEAGLAFVRKRGGPQGSGRTRFVTTGPVEPYRAAIEMILGPLGARDEVAHAAASLGSV
jgi:glutamate racemase